MVTPCFSILDIILAHDELNVSILVVVLAILRISASNEAKNLFEGIIPA